MVDSTKKRKHRSDDTGYEKDSKATGINAIVQKARIYWVKLLEDRASKLRLAKVVLVMLAGICVLLMVSGPRTSGRVQVRVGTDNLVPKKEKFALVVNPKRPKRVKFKENQSDLMLDRLQPLISVSNKKVKKDFFSDFRNLDELFGFFHHLKAKFPDQVSIGSIGMSAENRPLVAIRLGHNHEGNSNPNVLVIGTEHGREWMVPNALAYAMSSILSGETKVSELDGLDILKFVNLWFVPVVNPDGYAYTVSASSKLNSEEEKQKRFWRRNRQKNDDGTVGIDLNRNWGSNGFTWGWGQTWTNSEVYMGPSPFAAKETRAIRDWIQPGLATMKKDARFQRANKASLPMKTLTQGFVAVHCCIGGMLQPRNYCTIPPEIELLHENMGKEMCKQMNAVGHGNYGFKKRRKTREISSSGISIDWAFYDAKIPFPMMIETSPAKLDGERPSTEDDDDEEEVAPTSQKEIARARKERLRAKMSSDNGKDIPFVGQELAAAIMTHGGLVSGSLTFQSHLRTLEITPWGFPDVKNTFTCANPGKPDLIPADPCSKNKLKPWIHCKKQQRGGKRK